MTTIAINKIRAKGIAKLKLPGGTYDVLWFLLSAAQFDNNIEITQTLIADHLGMNNSSIPTYIKQLAENSLIDLPKQRSKFKATLNSDYFESLDSTYDSSSLPPIITITVSTKTANLISKLKLAGITHRLLWYLLGAANPNNIIELSQKIIAKDIITTSDQISAAIQILQDNSLITTLQRQPFITQLNTTVFTHS